MEQVDLNKIWQLLIEVKINLDNHLHHHEKYFRVMLVILACSLTGIFGALIVLLLK